MSTSILMPNHGNRNQFISTDINQTAYDVTNKEHRIRQLVSNIHSIFNRDTTPASHGFIALGDAGLYESVYTLNGRLPNSEEERKKQLFDFGQFFLSSSLDASESLKASGETDAVLTPTEKHKIVESLRAVLGLGPVDEVVVLGLPGDGSSAKEFSVTSLPPLFYPAASEVVVSPHDSPVTACPPVKVQPDAAEQVLPIDTYNAPKEGLGHNLKYESTISLPWQKVKINTGSLILVPEIDKIKDTLIEIKNKFFSMFGLDDSHLAQFNDKALSMKLYPSKADFLASHNMTEANSGGATGFFNASNYFLQGGVSKSSNVISTFVDADDFHKVLSHEYAHFLDAVFINSSFVSGDNTLKKALGWWTEGLASFLSFDWWRQYTSNNIPSDKLKYDMEEGNAYIDGARVHAFLDSTEPLKDIRKKIAESLTTGNKNYATVLIEHLIKYYSQEYRSWIYNNFSSPPH